MAGCKVRKFLSIAHISNTVDTKSPERQGFCAKIPDNAPPERLPRRYAYISFGTVPRVPMSTYEEKFRSFLAGLSSEYRARVLLAHVQDFCSVL